MKPDEPPEMVGRLTDLDEKLGRAVGGDTVAPIEQSVLIAFLQARVEAREMRVSGRADVVRLLTDGV